MTRKLLGAAALVLGVAFAPMGAAWASDDELEFRAAIDAAVNIPAPAEAAPVAPGLTPASDAAIDAISGRGAETTNIALTEQDLTAVNSGNTINAANVLSGAITMQDSALSGFAGVGNFMMNTGNNNNMQSSLSVTILTTR